jgi:mRNA interferase RelE/StbE
LANPRVESSRLSGMPDCYKIKLRAAGYRLVYQVFDARVVVVVVAVGKREDSAVYRKASKQAAEMNGR